MAHQIPQFYEKTRKPVPINRRNLQQIEEEFQGYISTAAEKIGESAKVRVGRASTANGITFQWLVRYHGVLLLAAALTVISGSIFGFGNMASQLAELTGEHDTDEFHSFLIEQIVSIPVFPLELIPGRPSPLCSTALGALVVRLMGRSTTVRGCRVLKDAIEQNSLLASMRFCMKRAGLLRALLEISKRATWALAPGDPSERLMEELGQVADEAGPRLAYHSTSRNSESRQLRKSLWR